MKINASQNDLNTRLKSAAAPERSPMDFKAVLAAAQRGTNGSGGSPAQTNSTGKSAAAAVAGPPTAAAELEEFLRKTPAEHMRDAVLKEMGLTEEDLDAMPPEQRAAVETTIAEKIKERLLAEDEHGRGETRSSSPTLRPAPILEYLMQEAMAQT